LGVLSTAAAFTFGLQFAAFLVASALETEIFYDVLGGLNFLALAWLGYPSSNSLSLLPYMTILFCISRGWLLVFLAWRAHSRKGDSRFDNVKNNPPVFFVYWMVQACWVYLITMPLLIVQRQADMTTRNDGDSSHASTQLSSMQILLLVGFAASVFLEVSSDVQKTLWVERGRVGGFCTDGWWKYSRHPNYAGEILQWWCAAALSISSSLSAPEKPQLAWISLVSPLFTMQILLTMSGTGVWHAEGKNLKRYYESKDAEKYVQYRKATPPLFPILIPGLYKNLPLWVKRWLCFEWERYEYKPSSTREATKS